jgi:FMN phosphatase YigB (HAD superfamily)
MKINAVISDMGGVIVNYRPPPACFDFIEDPKSKMEFIEPYWRQLESGSITGKDFYEIFRENFGYLKNYENFKKNFNEGFQFELNKEVFDFILSLKTKKNGPILYMLSNINKFHFDYINKRWPGVFSNFLRNFYSFELKMMKPQPEIFLYTKKHINFSVYNTIFIYGKKNRLRRYSI